MNSSNASPWSPELAKGASDVLPQAHHQPVVGQVQGEVEGLAVQGKRALRVPVAGFEHGENLKGGRQPVPVVGLSRQSDGGPGRLACLVWASGHQQVVSQRVGETRLLV